MNIDKIDNTSIYTNNLKPDNNSAKTKAVKIFHETLDSHLQTKVAELAIKDDILEKQKIGYLKNWISQGEFDAPENILNSAQNLLKYGV